MRQKIKSVPCFIIALSFCLLLFCSGFFDFSHAGMVSDTVQTITLIRNPVEGSPPVTQSYILIKIDNAVGTVILFVGGNGKLFLSDWQIYTGWANFLLRTRHHFAAEGFNVVVIDAASDFLLSTSGLLERRTGVEHLSDIAAVINDLPEKLGEDPGPIYLIGTSAGTISAGAYAAEIASNSNLPRIRSLVLTSSATRPINDTLKENLLDSVTLEVINVPCYLVGHENDKCYATPPSDIKIMKSRMSVGSIKVKAKLFTGGTSTLSGECESLSAHGFFGIEQSVVGSIGKWIRNQIENE
jgi:dienelactone hydrolase